MKLANFWQHLPGLWDFERSISNQHTQVGLLNVKTVNYTLHSAFESGVYKNEEQTFFRNYQFSWENDHLNIYGSNPKDGYVLLHSLSDESRVHTHLCNKDSYQFELEKFDLNNWSSVITITGPKKNTTIKTSYSRNTITSINF